MDTHNLRASTSSDNSSSISEHLRKNSRKRKESGYLFKYIFCTQIILYLESGAVPCLLDQMAHFANMSAQQQGALGGIVYLALSAASPLCGYLFKHHNPKTVLGISLAFNNVFVLMFALTPSGYGSTSLMLIASRALIGFTQSFVSVYSPLWVDEFAPRSKLAGWMSYLQGAVPVGVMLGYLFGVLVNGISSPTGYLFIESWRWPFIIQFILLLPLMFGIFFVPTEHLSIHMKHRCVRDTETLLEVDSKEGCSDILHHPHVIFEEDVHDKLRSWTKLDSEELNLPQRSAMRASYIVPRIRMDSYNVEDMDIESDISDDGTSTTYGTLPPLSASHSIAYSDLDELDNIDKTFCSSICYILRIKIYTLLVIGLASVYFVVTGVQYWGTVYMIKTLHAPRYVANFLFVVVSGTGPIMGVFFGGWLVDFNGGYKGVYQREKALRTCCYLGITAFILAALTTYTTDVYISATILWLFLFFGGSILPACTGIFISSVPRSRRPLASSLSIMVFNLLGYSMSPYLTGLIMGEVLRERGVAGTFFENCDDACTYRLGFRFCLMWCVWAVLFITAAWRTAKTDSIQRKREGLRSNNHLSHSPLTRTF